MAMVILGVTASHQIPKTIPAPAKANLIVPTVEVRGHYQERIRSDQAASIPVDAVAFPV